MTEDRLEMYLRMIRQHGSVTAAADALTASGINISKQAISAAFRRAHPNNAARIEYDKIKGKAGPKRRLYANRQECARACSKRFYEKKKKLGLLKQQSEASSPIPEATPVSLIKDMVDAELFDADLSPSPSPDITAYIRKMIADGRLPETRQYMRRTRQDLRSVGVWKIIHLEVKKLKSGQATQA